MNFNSNSVIFHRGVNHRVGIELPNQLNSYDIPDMVWEDSIKEFNHQLDKRPHVTIKFFLKKDIKVDVLRIHRALNTLALWLIVKGDEIDIVDRMPFKLKGEVIFAENSEVKVDKMIIQDIVYEEGKGIFSNKS